MTKKLLLRAMILLAAVWICGCAAIYAATRQPPETFARFMTRIPAPVAFLAFPFETLWTQARAGSLELGDAAPDFALDRVDKTNSLRLSALTAERKPVVLIFGSYT